MNAQRLSVLPSRDRKARDGHKTAWTWPSCYGRLVLSFFFSLAELDSVFLCFQLQSLPVFVSDCILIAIIACRLGLCSFSLICMAWQVQFGCDEAG